MTDTEKKIAEIREALRRVEFGTYRITAFADLEYWLRFLLSELDRIQQEYAEERAAHNAHVTELCEKEEECRKLRKELDLLQELAVKVTVEREKERKSAQQEIERLQQERAELIEGLRIATDVLGTVPMNDARLWGVYNKLCDILKEIGVTVE